MLLLAFGVGTWASYLVQFKGYRKMSIKTNCATPICAFLFITTAHCELEKSAKAANTQNTAVFIVHGTYGGDEHWVNIVDGRHTFASELKRTLGMDAVTVPFLWRSSIHHEVRVAAAERLARQLDQPQYAGHRIVIIAHSHGGNVALEACGRCSRKVDTVICLSTPHMYLLTKGSDENPLPLPIYCSPEARQNIGEIISISAANDVVVNSLASFRQGLDEQTALTWTYNWRKRFDNPRLIDDGDALREWFEDFFKLTLSGNLAVGGQMNVADFNISVGSMTSGLESHNAIHSARMGALLGELINDGISDDKVSYLQSLVIPADSDHGGPIDEEAYAAWWRRYGPHVDFSGWLLTDITVTGTKQTKPVATGGQRGYQYWDVDHSWPDVSLCIQDPKTQANLFSGNNLMDKPSTKWQPSIHLRRDTSVNLVVTDRDLIAHDVMGTFSVHASGMQQPPASYWTEQFAVEMSWTAAHF